MGLSCQAPRMALYFAPSGFVYACDRTRYPLGSIAESTLREIWNGPRRCIHSEWVGAGDLSHGCSDCDQPPGEWTQSSTFDDRIVAPLSGYPEYLDFALSNRCNLQCVMCDGELSSAIRTRREGREPLTNHYDDRFFVQLADYLPYAREVSFKGGEPFLQDQVYRVFDMLLDQGLTPKVIVTTNGTIWNDTVEHYLRELGIDVYLSVDGVTADTVESIRVGCRFDRLQDNIRRFRETVRSTGRTLTLNYCLMDHNWHELGAFIEGARARGDGVSVLPVLAPADRALLRLPQEDQARILTALEDEGRIRSLTGTDPAWDDQLNRLRRAVATERPRPGIPVEVVISRRGEVDDAQLEAPDALEKWGAGVPVRLELEDNVIARVELPEGAPPILADVGWIGAFMGESMFETLEPVLGSVEEMRQQTAGSRDFDCVVRFEPGSALHELRSIGLPAHFENGALRQLVFIGYRPSAAARRNV